LALAVIVAIALVVLVWLSTSSAPAKLAPAIP
jgi:hypothetical protein